MNRELQNMIESYQNPSADYSPVEMWFWNGDIDKEGITYQLEQFHNQNIADFFIHPTCGMTVPYLSEEYFELICHVVKEAKRLGMRYWIYDEFDWPSGIAGGMLLEQYPEYQAKELAGQRVQLSAEEEGCTVSANGSFLCAQRIEEKAGRFVVTDITSDCEVQKDVVGVTVQYCKRSMLDEQVMFYFCNPSDLLLPSAISRKNTKAAPGYANMLRPETIAKFIEMTHEKYKEAVGEEFGKTVKGVFFDEPISLYRFAGPIPGPWDDEFFAMFEEEHGYSLRPYMYALFYEARTPQEVKARDDYRTTVKHRYHQTFIKQIVDWCHANNLLVTGHFDGEERLQWYIFQGDMFVEAMQQDVPGLDSIYSLQKIEDNDFNVAGKLISSAAKFAGADRILCETYTMSGWHMRMADMKRIANRLLVLGVNMIQYMGAMYSLRGVGKANGEHTYFNPLFKKYHVFHKYVAGLSYLSAVTKPAAKILVFIPLRQSIQKHNMLEERISHPGGKEHIQRIYEDTVNGLLYEGMGFDLISEDLADRIVVHERSVEAYGYQYDCVVFPGMHYVNKKTADLIERLQGSSTKVIFSYALPQKVVDTKETLDLEEMAEKQNCCLIQPTTWFCQLDEYRKILKEYIGHVSLNIASDGRVYISRRSNAFSDVYFMCNDENRNVSVSIDFVKGMKIYHAETQEELPCQEEDGKILLDMEGYQMLVVICEVPQRD